MAGVGLVVRGVVVDPGARWYTVRFAVNEPTAIPVVPPSCEVFSEEDPGTVLGGSHRGGQSTAAAPDHDRIVLPDVHECSHLSAASHVGISLATGQQAIDL